jgi:hypothetical protein
LGVSQNEDRAPLRVHFQELAILEATSLLPIFLYLPRPQAAKADKNQPAKISHLR